MLRYKVNLQQKLKDAGYSTYRLRQEKLLPESTVHKLRTGNMALSFATLNIICSLLQCQPGDILEWVPEDGTPGEPEAER